MRKTLKKLFLSLFVTALVFTFGFFTVRSIIIQADQITLKGVDLIYANPCEDCSSEITVSWHSGKKASVLYYTTYDDPDFENAVSIEDGGKIDNTSFDKFDKCTFYKHEVKLTNLKPDTTYLYKITSNGYTSTVHKFKTAGTSDFSFAYVSDLHLVNYNNLELGMSADERQIVAQTLIDNCKTAVGGELNFVYSTGDEVWRGSQYSNWQEWTNSSNLTATSDYMWASGIGNHEYYSQYNESIWNYYPSKWEASEDRSKIYTDPESFYYTYFDAVKAVPENGPTDNPATYWFIYNNVLFIQLDSMQCNEYGQLGTMRAWFEKVVQANEGKYQYIIVGEHYPWYNFQDGDSKYADKWSDLFDKYGVDLALSGHVHGYMRTKSIYDGEVVEDGKGTVYCVAPQIGDRPKVVTNETTNADKIAFRESTIGYDKYSGISAITVTKEGITCQFLDYNGTVHDEFTIPARREYTVNEDTKEKVESTLALSSSNDAIYLDINPKYYTAVKRVAVKINGEPYQTYDFTSTYKKSYIKIGDLTANTNYDISLDITYLDDTYTTITKKIGTSLSFGSITSLKITSGEQMKLSWSATLNEGIVSKYNIYADGVLLGSVDKSETSFVLDKSKVNANTVITLEAVTANDIIVYSNDAKYTLYGDVNMDGAVNNDDVSALYNAIAQNTDFNDGYIALVDNNGDGIVDVGDAIKMLAYIQEKITTYKNQTYDVIFVNEIGNIISYQTVNAFEAAEAPSVPEVAGKVFVGWSQDFSEVTNSMIVRPLYN